MIRCVCERFFAEKFSLRVTIPSEIYGSCCNSHSPSADRRATRSSRLARRAACQRYRLTCRSRAPLHPASESEGRLRPPATPSDRAADNFVRSTTLRSSPSLTNGWSRPGCGLVGTGRATASALEMQSVLANSSYALHTQTIMTDMVELASVDT